MFLKKRFLFFTALSLLVFASQASASSNITHASDFDGDGMVDTPDFLLFVKVFGAKQGEGLYDALYDLDHNGIIGIPDFLIFIDDFGKTVPSFGNAGRIVAIPDPNLCAAIETHLNKARGATITQADMWRLTTLRAPNADIKNLTGLAYATNLKTLSLGVADVNGKPVNNNSISDISVLSGLTSLTWLDLRSNNISDISSLSGLTNLEYLFFDNNNISDISALSNLTRLTDLSLANNNISDISALSGLTNLTDLSLGSNNISDISSLSNLTRLIWLNLDNTNISDISSLSGLTNLAYLYLYNNSISDLAPLVANVGLGRGSEVDVRNNPLSPASINTHISTLQGRGVSVQFGSSKPAVGELRRMPRALMNR